MMKMGGRKRRRRRRRRRRRDEEKGREEKGTQMLFQEKRNCFFLSFFSFFFLFFLSFLFLKKGILGKWRHRTSFIVVVVASGKRKK